MADFRTGYDSSRWEAIWGDFHCDWRALLFGQGIEPPSWVAGDAALAAGARGILFPSCLPAGGTNLVLFTEALDPRTGSLMVFDPNQALPKNQGSWK